MGENTSNNFFVIFSKFLGFILLLLLSVGITAEFVKAAYSSSGTSQWLLPGSVFFCFFYYLFVRDLNDPYKTVQTFFFRVPWFSRAISFLLVLAGLICWAITRFSDFDIDRSIFIFLGGFIAASHLIYVSRDMPRESFVDLIDYLFGLNVYYFSLLLLLGLYFCFIFDFNPIKAFADGCALTFELVSNLIKR